MIERYPTFCELLNGDICDICHCQISGTNLVFIALAPFDLLIVLAQLYSCLEFDLTLNVIPSVYVVFGCSLIFSKLLCV
jgi:hypothetical protein